MNYQCIYCNHNFVSKYDLRRHLKRKKLCLSKEDQVIKMSLILSAIIEENKKLKQEMKELKRGMKELKREIIQSESKLYTPQQITINNGCDVSISQNNEIENKETEIPSININYIYLLKEREFIKTKEDIYKIGKTRQSPNNRLTGYPKSSEVILFLEVPDCDIIEKTLIEIFKDVFIQRKDIGTEYFEGDKNKMIEIIFENVTQEG